MSNHLFALAQSTGGRSRLYRAWVSLRVAPRVTLRTWFGLNA